MAQLVNSLFTEFLKLKRSQMFLISLMGAAVAPGMEFLAMIVGQRKHPETVITFQKFFTETNLYILLLIGILLYGVITAYLFNREYVEDTLKNLLTIPVSRNSFLSSKFTMLFIWILFLTLFAWILTLILGLIGQFDGLNSALLIKSFQEYLVGGILIFLLLTPIAWVTLIFKNYVTTIVFTILITMINALVLNSEYVVLYPWSAILAIATNKFNAIYPSEYSYFSVFGTSLLGLIATIIYFKKVDID